MTRKRRSRFPETRWSLVGRAGASDDATRLRALSELLVAYAPGLRAFLVETRRVPVDLVDDLLHDFVADKVLARKLVHHADEGRGRFRSFVVKALNNFVTTKLKREYAARSRRAGLDPADLPDAPSTDRFETAWVRQVVDDALDRMEADCAGRGRDDLWEIFRLRVVDPLLHGAEPVDYAEIVRRFEVRTPRQAMNLLATAKRSFVRHLREAVGQYVHDESHIDDEIEGLRQIVGRA